MNGNENTKNDERANQQVDKKPCPLCRSSIDKGARVCSVCRKDIGSWIDQIVNFLGHYIIPIALGSATVFLCNYYMNTLLNSSNIAGNKMTAPQAVNSKEGNLTYAYKVEKVGETRASFLGLFPSVTELYDVVFATTNNTESKLTKLRISLELSNDITSHKLPFGFEIFDKEKEQEVKNKDLESYFVGKNKVNIMIPVFHSKDNFYMRLGTKGHVRVDDISVYSDETKGVKGEFVNK